MSWISKNAIALAIPVLLTGLVASPRGNEVGLAEAANIHGLCTLSYAECYVAVSQGEGCATDCLGTTKYLCSATEYRCDYFASGPEGYEAYECATCSKQCPGSKVSFCTPGTDCKVGCQANACNSTTRYIYGSTQSTEADCPDE